MDSDSFAVTFPLHGDVLNSHDGEETAEGLQITVRGAAPEGVEVRIGGRTANRQGASFSGPATLTTLRNSLRVEAGGHAQELTLWWNKSSRKRFRFSSDDNIEFLKDLAAAPDRYPSLFDHFYLGFWREMHATFGAKIHLNIYYQTDGFDLTEMPDRWKDEWQANADWLHLSFHALQDKPDRPYRNARYAQLAHDFDLVTGEIARFAGPEVLGNTTTVHWADAPREALTALRERGIRNLIGLFEEHHGECTTGYQLSLEETRHCDSRGAWHDAQTGLVFVRCTAVVNTLEAGEIPAYLNARTATPQTAEMLELLIHEQYFRRELALYQPTILDKVRAALAWATERDYEPVFWSEGFLGAPYA